jgi:hypothetical protein
MNNYEVRSLREQKKIRQIQILPQITEGMEQNPHKGKKIFERKIIRRTLHKRLSTSTTICVADPGCLSRILDLIFSIPDPGSRVDKISDPGLTRSRIRIKEFK